MKQFIIILISSFIYFNSSAQEKNQTKAWSLGTEKGYAQIAGEVSPANGFGFGIYGDKSFTNYLSARLVIGMGDVRGLDRTTSTNWLNHPVWNGSLNPAINYNTANSNSIYANYKTNYQEASLQAIFTLTQLAFFKNNSPYDLFLLGGMGAMRYTTKIDATNEFGDIYDFAIADALQASNDAERVANLNTIADGNYETQTNADPEITLLYQFGGGLKWKLRKNIALSLSHRVSIAGTDDLDSYLWDPNNTVNGVNDIHQYTTIGLSYTFSKKAKEDVSNNPYVQPDLTINPEPEIDPVDLTTNEKEVVKRAFENTEFETNKAIIRPVSFASLNELATLLLEHPSWKLKITGHTDNVGDSESNMDLSKRRTESVRLYLSKRGVEPSRCIVSWHGEEQPIADNSTIEGRQRNRRVEYEIVE